ncbi:MAG: hypothetical protein J6A54_01605 [Clostridia bacterium]|nr:hypothetical protein [Clostridia bacterium]
MAKNEKKKGSLALRIISAVLCLIIVLVLIVAIGFSIGENLVFIKFYMNADKEFKIPGLWTGSVPQGFEYIDDMDTFIYTGYQKDKVSASVIYVMPDDGEGEPRCIEMLNNDGTPYTGHAGGITIHGDITYVATSKGVDLFSTFDMLDSDNKVTKIGKISTDIDVAFCEVNGNKLYLGNFYRAVDYETPESNHITTPSGDKNTAVIYEYDIDPALGVPRVTEPVAVYSIGNAIQGLAFTEDGRMILSSSWGLSKSHIYVHKKPEASGQSFELKGRSIPLYFLDSSTLEKDIIAPPMAEELVYEDGDIYIMNEAASMKYLFGKLTGAKWCYAYELED